MATLVDIKDLTVTYDGDKVLDNVSLSIEEGEMIGIIGRSGSGKTVLLNVLRGLDDSIPATGQIVYHGAACDRCGRVEPPGKAGGPCPKCGGSLSPISEDILNGADPAIKRNISRRVAIMIQRTFGIYGDDSVIENVMKALDDSEYSGDRIMRAADIIDQVKLSHRMMHIARDLSGGEKQRVVMARQLAREPMMLLADEPTGTLDPKTAQVVHQNLKKLSKELGITVLITSHFPEVIEEMATRALLLENGRIKMLGRPKDIIKAFTGGIEAVKRKEVQAGGSVIRVEGLFKKYFSVDRGVINAVNGVSFDIREGEIFGIVGTSGAGKTSLTNILTGNLEPTSGMVEMKVGETGSTCANPGTMPGAGLSLISACSTRTYDLYPHRTVIENMTDSIGLEFPAELAQKRPFIRFRYPASTRREAAISSASTPGSFLRASATGSRWRRFS